MAFIFIYCYFVLISFGGANSEVKRILINDPDVVQQVMLLKQEMEQLKTESQAMKQEIIQLNKSLAASEVTRQFLNQEISQLTNNLSATQLKLNSMGDLKHEIMELNTKMCARSGAVYIRWGRTTCSGPGTELVYSGYTGGQDRMEASTRGGPSNYLCLPHDPELTNRSISTGSHLYGTEYQDNILRSDALDEDAPCAVCQSPNRTSSVMIPGRKTCYNGWTEEYNGYLASDRLDLSASSFICIDKDIEYIPGGVMDQNGRLLYLTTTKCGSLSCPPYKDNQLVYCVVCSK